MQKRNVLFKLNVLLLNLLINITLKFKKTVITFTLNYQKKVTNDTNIAEFDNEAKAC